MARFGGDEFAAIIHPPGNETDAMSSAERFAQRLREPYRLQVPGLPEALTAVVGASIGLSLFPDDARDSETLLHAADTALYNAKRRGKNQSQRA